MWERAIGNDNLKSLRVPFGYAVDLYEDVDFGGEMVTIVGGISEDENQTMACINLDDFEDNTSSLRVYKNRQIGPAKLQWVSITST